MGRWKTAKQRNSPLTPAQERYVTDRINVAAQEAKTAATQDATIIATELIYLALHNAFGFSTGRLIKLQAEVDRISDLITDGVLSLDDVERDLESIGVGIVRE